MRLLDNLVIESLLLSDTAASSLETPFLQRATREEYKGYFRQDVADEALLPELHSSEQRVGAVISSPAYVSCWSLSGFLRGVFQTERRRFFI